MDEAKKTCEICGQTFAKSLYMEPYQNICSSECLNKKFWLEIIEEKECHPVIDGVCYYLDRNNLEGKRGFQGFAGRRFKIRFLDTGEEVVTTNLWHNGEVPEEFRDRLPDTAEFVKEAKHAPSETAPY